MSRSFLQRARMGFFLAWIPLSALLWLLLSTLGNMGAFSALILTLPLCLLYAFVCRSSWHLCRVMPARRTPMSRLLLVHLSASGLISAGWVFLAAGLCAWPWPLLFTWELQGLMLFVTGVLFYLLSVAFHYVILSIEEARLAEQQVIQAQVWTREAELKALHAQLNPHFLFNSLHSISALTGLDPVKARDMCLALSEFLRTTLGMSDKASVTLEEELALARRYLAIEQIRFGERLRVIEDIEPDCLKFRVPPLLLQPLVENAIKHGVASRVDGGAVKIKARREQEGLELCIENPFDAESSHKQGQGKGLNLTRERLSAFAGESAALRVSVHSDLYQACLWLPEVKPT